MGQHYTSLTVETSAWCNKCGKMTPHRVADKRLQYCLPCYKKSADVGQQARLARDNDKPKQMDLFG